MQIQKAADFCVQILVQYYDNHVQPFLDACHEDVLWIGPAEKQIIRGRSALVQAFSQEEHSLHFVLRALKVVPIPTVSPHVAEILMMFQVDTIWPDHSTNTVHQRIQLTITEQSEEFKIRLCHISNSIVYDERDRIYPVHYDSGYKDWALAGEARAERMCVRGPDKTLMYLRRPKVTYVETVGRHTRVHTEDDQYLCLDSMHTLMQQYQDWFVRIHASYLVNPRHVLEISRFRVRLSDGTVLPVPEKRFTAIRNQLQAAQERQKLEEKR